MSTADLSEVPPRLRRDVGLLPLFMVSAGSVIGSGWLLGTLNASKVAGPAAIISWIIGVILLIGIALIYAELGSTYPISGSTARFTWIHAGTLGGFFAGTFSYLQAMAVAPIEVEATLGYLNAKVWHGLVTPAGLLTGKGLIVAIGFMFVFTALNLLGIKWMARTNTVATWWKIFVPLLTIVFIMTKVFHSGELHRGRRVHAVRHQGRVHRDPARHRLRPGGLRAGRPAGRARRVTPSGTCRSRWSAPCSWAPRSTSSCSWPSPAR